MPHNSGRAFSRWMIAVVAMSLSVLMVGAAWYYRHQEQQYKRVAMDQLSAIGRLKANQIENWRNERFGDAAVLSESPFLREAIASLLAAPNAERASRMRSRFTSLTKHYHYADVLLVGPEGRIHLSLNGHIHTLPGYRTALAEAFRTRKPAFTNLHTDSGHPAPHISVVAPLFAEEGLGRKPIGAIVLINDASQFLFPLIQSWPTPSKTAETLLVARDGDDALILNNLHHSQDAALKLRIPLKRTDVPAVMAVLGKQGIVTGKDYRGEDVMAAVLPIPGSPWYMVAKVDREELLADWHTHSLQFLALFLALTGGMLAAGTAAWQWNRKTLYRAMYHAESKLHTSVQRRKITLESIGDAVISTDSLGRVEFLNPVAENLTGWSLSETMGKPLAEVFHIINEKTRETIEDPVAKVLRERIAVGLANHTLLIAKDGREIPIADSAAPIRDDSGTITGVVLVFRDQIEENRAHHLLQARLNLLDYATNHSLEELLTKALDEAGNLVNSPIGFYHFVDADQNSLSLQQWSTRTRQEFCRAEGNGMHYPIAQAGVWADCVRKARPVIHNDYALLPYKKGLPDGHAEVVRELVVPIIREGKVVAILGVGNKPADYTDDDVETVAYLADITWNTIEQKRLAEKLRENESFLNTLFETTPLPLYYKDRDGLYRGFNKAFEAFLGTTRDNVIGKTVFDVNSRELAEIYQAKDLELLESGGTQQYESKARNVQGELRDVIFSKAVLSDSHGNIIGLIGAILDITERKRAEQALQESEFFFKESQRAAFIGSYKCDFTTGFWESSEILDQIFGIDKSYSKSVQGWLDIVHPDDRQMMERYLREEVISKRKPFDKEYRIIRKRDGEIRWVSGLGKVDCDIDDNVISMIGTIQDVTERCRAEEALHESEDRFRRVSSLISDIAYSCTSDEEGNYSISWMTGATERICGYTIEEIRAQTCWKFLVAEEDIPFFEMNVSSLAPGFHGSCELRIRHRNGSLVWVASHAECVRDTASGSRNVLYGALVDITAHKLAEEEQEKLHAQLNQAHKMESVGRLAGGVAHDFNNMLGVIIGHAELALMKSDPNQSHYSNLQAIHKAAEHSADLTRQLLAFARKQAIAPTELDMNETVHGMLSVLERLIGEDIQLAWIPGTGVWPVKMDPIQINQILTNLCVNARDAITGVGKVIIETSNAIIGENYCAAHPEFVQGEYVRLSVSDSGSGMDRETLSNIFDPFFTTKGAGKGTGLGLATVYGIVKQNNGFINVYSEPDQGTTFEIYLPRLAFASSMPETVAPEPVKHGQEAVLLVEDQPEILEIGKTLLENLGYTVLAAGTPGDAIELAMEHNGDIDLLLTDVILPEMNGRELSRKIITLYPNITTLYMSGYTADVITHRGVLDEGVHFIHKPFSIQDLAKKVREALDKK